MVDYKIIKKPEEAICYKDSVIASADENSEYLGFLPKGSYSDNIKAGKIWVAVDSSNEYVGHIMFGGRPPYNVRVFQIFVIKAFRKRGLASNFIDDLKIFAEKQMCFTLDAHIAEDLVESVKFYEAQGFYKNCDRLRQSTTGRKIIIYTCKLNTPSLLDERPFSLLNTVKTYGRAGLVDKYVLDLNILFELLQKRSRYNFVVGMLKSALAGEIKIQVTPEFKTELRRNEKLNDPMLEFAALLPVLMEVNQEKLTDIVENLRLIIFPKRSRNGRRANNDNSDLKHIAYCIHYGIPAFVTLEDRLLDAREDIQAQYNIQICSPIDIGLSTDTFNYQEVDTITDLIDMKAVRLEKNPNFSKMQEFLNRFCDWDEEIYAALSTYPSDHILDVDIAYLGEQPVAIFFVEERKRESCLVGYVLVVQDVPEELLPILDHFLETFSRATQRYNPSEIKLFGSNILFLNTLCLKRGYILDNAYKGKQNLYKKLTAPKVVSKANWREFKEVFEKGFSVELPDKIPVYKTDGDGQAYVDVREQQGYQRVGLFHLETLFSPTTFLLPERTGVIVAIRVGYSEGLISRSPNLLPFAIESEAFLRLEKAYFRSPKNSTKLFRVGMPIVFYESKSGRGAIGSARITSTSIVSVSDAIRQYKRNGVLSEKELENLASEDGEIHIVTFDNFQEFVTPVPFSDLRKMGCGKASFVSPEKVDVSHLNQIIHTGHRLQMKDPLISINPKYVSKIISGKKTIELRRRPLPSTEGGKIWIYATAPEQSIKATARVSQTHIDTPSEIWKKYADRACISKEGFDSYFEGSDIAYAIELIDVKELNREVKLSQIKKWLPSFTPPQFFRYLNHDSDMYIQLNDFIYTV